MSLEGFQEDEAICCLSDPRTANLGSTVEALLLWIQQWVERARWDEVVEP